MVARWLPATSVWYFSCPSQVKRKKKASLKPLHRSLSPHLMSWFHYWNNNNWTGLSYVTWFWSSRQRLRHVTQNNLFNSFMCVYVCVQTHLCLHVHTGTHMFKSTMFIFETGSLTSLELTNLLGLAGHWVLKIYQPVSAFQVLGSQRCTTCLASFSTWVLGIESRSVCFCGKHFTKRTMLKPLRIAF